MWCHSVDVWQTMSSCRPEIQWAHFGRCSIRDGDEAIRCILLIALNCRMRQVIGTNEHAFGGFCKPRACFESHNNFSCSTRYSLFTHTHTLTIWRYIVFTRMSQTDRHHSSTHYVHLFYQGRALIYLFDLIWFTFAVVLHLPSLYEN